MYFRQIFYAHIQYRNTENAHTVHSNFRTRHVGPIYSVTILTFDNLITINTIFSSHRESKSYGDGWQSFQVAKHIQWM